MEGATAPTPITPVTERINDASITANGLPTVSNITAIPSEFIRSALRLKSEEPYTKISITAARITEFEAPESITNANIGIRTIPKRANLLSSVSFSANQKSEHTIDKCTPETAII